MASTTSLPKWRPLMHETPTSWPNNLLGLTPPAVAFVALAIFLCIFLEFNRRVPHGPNRIHRKTQNGVHWGGSKFSMHWQWPFPSQLVTSCCSFHSHVLNGVLDLENEVRELLCVPASGNPASTVPVFCDSLYPEATESNYKYTHSCFGEQLKDRSLSLSLSLSLSATNMELAPETETLTLAISEQIRVDGTLTEASLSTDGKIRWKTESGERRLAIESEVLGFSAECSRIRVRALVQREGWSCGDGGGGNRARRDLVLEPITEESKIAWCGKLKEFIYSLDRPKKLFILVNPFGGKKCALNLFHKQVKPLLAAADIQYTLQETQYQLHAKEIVNSLDLSKYDGIVCVSGDGVLVEVVNGLLQRGDWDAAIKMPLGIVPAGTGNGMIKSLLDSVGDACSVSNAIFSVIRGHKRSLDVATVLQGETRFFSVLMLTWGLVADIDIESEKYRWMGSARLEFYGILRVICLRKYDGCISFVPAPGYETYGDPIDQKNRWSQKQDDNSEVQQCGYQGPITCLENMEWKIIEGPFISVWLHNVPWASEDTMPAPNAKFADGYLDLIIIRDCPKSALLSMLAKLSDGDYVKSPYVLYLKVKAFRLEPGQRVGEPTKGGIIDSDGEVLARGERTYKCGQVAMMAYGPIQMTVDKGLATLFSPV